nr:hypothetical protein [Tanacetum cinerariifolium]
MSNKVTDNMGNEVAQTKSDLFLDELVVGVTGTIVVRVCRIWGVNDVTGRYLSTDIVVSYTTNWGKLLLFLYSRYATSGGFE